MNWDPDAWTRNLIADMRANGGTPSTGPLAGKTARDPDLDGREDRRAADRDRDLPPRRRRLGDRGLEGRRRTSTRRGTTTWSPIRTRRSRSTTRSSRSSPARRPARSATGSGTTTSRRSRSSATTRARRPGSSRCSSWSGCPNRPRPPAERPGPDALAAPPRTGDRRPVARAVGARVLGGRPERPDPRRPLLAELPRPPAARRRPRSRLAWCDRGQ